jgi:hypothetical protein
MLNVLTSRGGGPDYEVSIGVPPRLDRGKRRSPVPMRGQGTRHAGEASTDCACRTGVDLGPLLACGTLEGTRDNQRSLAAIAAATGGDRSAGDDARWPGLSAPRPRPAGHAMGTSSSLAQGGQSRPRPQVVTEELVAGSVVIPQPVVQGFDRREQEARGATFRVPRWFKGLKPSPEVGVLTEVFLEVRMPRLPEEMLLRLEVQLRVLREEAEQLGQPLVWFAGRHGRLEPCRVLEEDLVLDVDLGDANGGRGLPGNHRRPLLPLGGGCSPTTAPAGMTALIPHALPGPCWGHRAIPLHVHLL